MSDFLALFDLQTLTIWATVVSVSAATIYAIMNLTMKETSFEEAVLQQTGKVIKQPTATKTSNKKAKKVKQQQNSAKSTSSSPAVQEAPAAMEVVEEKIIVPVKSTPLMKSKNNSDKQSKNKNTKRTDKDIATGKGLSREALQIHDLIQELLLSENDTELLVDELTRFSPKILEKTLLRHNKSNKKAESKPVQGGDSDKIQAEYDECKQKLRISDKLVESLSVQSKSLMETSESHKKQIQSLKNETESLRNKERIPDQRDLVKKLNGEISELNKQVDVHKAKTQGIDVSNMKKQLDIITGELTKSAIKVNAAENSKRMHETRAITLQKKLENLENSMNEKQNKSAENDQAMKELSALRLKHEEAESRLTEHLRLQAASKQEYTRAKATNDTLVKDNEDKLTALEHLSEEKNRISNDFTNLQNQFTSNNLLMETKSEELSKAHSNIDKMNAELSEQKKKNDVLRTRNTSVVDSLAAIEKENLMLKTDMHKITNKVKNSDETDAEFKTLKKTHDDVLIGHKVASDKSKCEIDQLTKTVKSLESKVKESDDKTKTHVNLQDNLKGEIKLANEKICELLKVNESLKNAAPVKDNSLEGLSKELRAKNETIEKQLEKCNAEKKELLNSLEDIKTSKYNVESELNNYKKVLNDTESSLKQLQASIIKEQKMLNDKIETLTADNIKQVMSLSEDMKKMQTENVKLNGIIKTGKDALDAEQECNKKLKEQIQQQQQSKATNNGVASNPDDYVKLKKRLGIVESLLEKERALSKNNSQKLGA